MPGIASGITWWKITCNFEAPIPYAASLTDGGTALIAALEEIIIVGKVINANTIPPTKGIDLGIPKILIKIASPIIPKTTDGTAAKLLIFTSIISVILFFLAISSK